MHIPAGSPHPPLGGVGLSWLMQVPLKTHFRRVGAQRRLHETLFSKVQQKVDLEAKFKLQPSSSRAAAAQLPSSSSSSPAAAPPPPGDAYIYICPVDLEAKFKEKGLSGDTPGD